MFEYLACTRMRVSLLVVALMSLTCSAMAAQPAQAQQTTHVPDDHAVPAKAAAFDAVSIRPSAGGSMFSFRLTSDGYSAINQPLWLTILFAYFPHSDAFLPSTSKEIVGAPPWVSNDRYDIQAKVDEATAKEWKNMTVPQRWEALKPMLQTMLADRCKLVQHSETTELPIYALVIGKHGAKLKETKPGESPPSGAIHMFAGDDGSMMVPSHRGDPRPTLTFFNTSMASLANQISNGAPRRIQDQTGLTGRYDFVLPKLEDLSPTDPPPPTTWNIEELGLTLKPAKAPMRTLVIDHIERPSEN